MIIGSDIKEFFGTIVTDYSYNGLDIDDTLYFFLLRYIDDNYRTETISVLAPARLIHVGENDYGRQVWISGNLCKIQIGHPGIADLECILCNNVIYSPVELRTSSWPNLALGI